MNAHCWLGGETVSVRGRLPALHVAARCGSAPSPSQATHTAACTEQSDALTTGSRREACGGSPSGVTLLAERTTLMTPYWYHQTKLVGGTWRSRWLQRVSAGDCGERRWTTPRCGLWPILFPPRRRESAPKGSPRGSAPPVPLPLSLPFVARYDTSAQLASGCWWCCATSLDGADTRVAWMR